MEYEKEEIFDWFIDEEINEDFALWEKEMLNND